MGNDGSCFVLQLLFVVVEASEVGRAFEVPCQVVALVLDPDVAEAAFDFVILVIGENLGFPYCIVIGDAVRSSKTRDTSAGGLLGRVVERVARSLSFGRARGGRA
jgi:hypothetical protein